MTTIAIANVPTSDLILELRARGLLPVVFGPSDIPVWVDLDDTAKAEWFNGVSDQIEDIVTERGNAAIDDLAGNADLPTVDWVS